MKTPSPPEGRGPGRGGRAKPPRPAAPPLPTLSPPGERVVTLAVVIGAHGVAGEVRLKLFGEGLETLKAHKTFNGGALTLSKIRSDNKGGAIARFAEVTDRSAAEKLRGAALTVPRAALPPLEEGEFYHADLIGLPAVTDAGEPVGTIVAVANYGATDLVEIEKPAGEKFLVPLIPQAIPEWNAERLLIDPAFVQ